MKNLEERMNAMQIVEEAGMSNRPEFYSGRGAISCDLNGKILEKVYELIEKEHGKDASKQFVQMVADVPKLSATDFLLSLYRLEGHNWKWDKQCLGDENGIYIDGPNDEAKMVVGFATIAGALFGQDSRDETEIIRGAFLVNHGIKKKQGSICIGLNGEYRIF